MFAKNNLSKGVELEKRYNSARANLLLVTLFSAINIILLVTNSDKYFLFSAYIPYCIADFAMYYCGLYPAEYYGEFLADAQFLDMSAFAVMMGIAGIILLLYFLSWIFSKKNRVGWIIFSLIFFVIDTAVMYLIFGFQMSNIVDTVFHFWVIVSLTMGIVSGFKLKKLKTTEPEAEISEEIEGALVNSEILRPADPFVKSRKLLEANVLGYNVEYRRVQGRVNELVIDGNVYDEFTAFVEAAHTLKANYNGHLIEVGYDGFAHSFIKADGEIVEKKLRLY